MVCRKIFYPYKRLLHWVGTSADIRISGGAIFQIKKVFNFFNSFFILFELIFRALLKYCRDLVVIKFLAIFLKTEQKYLKITMNWSQKWFEKPFMMSRNSTERGVLVVQGVDYQRREGFLNHIISDRTFSKGSKKLTNLLRCSSFWKGLCSVWFAWLPRLLVEVHTCSRSSHCTGLLQFSCSRGRNLVITKSYLLTI